MKRKKMQLSLFQPELFPLESTRPRLNGGLLKWIGNKARSASEIVSAFPKGFGTYFEPFLGSAAVLGSVAPKKGVGSDTFTPLVDIWKTLVDDPTKLKLWYRERYEFWAAASDKRAAYETIKASYNRSPNSADLLFLCRSCYGGVVRFRKADGYMSTPVGPHTPISPDSFDMRADNWHQRLSGTTILHADYTKVMRSAEPGDLVYCDPPYSHSQAILYGAQDFRLADLFKIIGECKARGVYVALSIDGTKKSGNVVCDVPYPESLFEREILVDCGRSMLKRFQMDGKTLEAEHVEDRLLL